MGKHIAFFNIPAIGHIYPTLAVVAELVRRGHRVTYTTIDERRPLLESFGATVHSYRSLRPADSDPTPPVPPRSAYLSRTLLGFLDEATSVYAQLAPVYRDYPPDLVVFDRMAFAGRVLAEAMSLPSVQLWPMLVSNEHWSMGTVDPDDPDIAAYAERLSSFLDAACPSLDPALFLSPSPSRHLAFYPRQFQYAGELFDQSYSFVGPCLRHPPDLWRAPGDEPVLLVTLGTIYNANVEFYRCCADAFADSPWHVVMAVGQRIDLAELGALPSNVEAHRVVPQLDVLAAAEAVVCHAGMGGVMEAVNFGVPVLAVPQTLEQEANASRVEALNLGTRLSPDAVTPSAIRDAVEIMVKDPAIADGVVQLRRAIQASGGSPRAADVIEECLC